MDKDVQEVKNKMEEQKDMDWLDNVKAPPEVQEMTGVVQEIRQPREVETSYGKRKLIEFVVAGQDGMVTATEYAGSAFPIVTPNSNLGKIMKRYGCKTLRQLLGKEVKLRLLRGSFWKIVKE